MSPNISPQCDPKNVLTTASFSNSTPVAFTVGTGQTIYKDLLLPAILEAQHEIILATCFWARSATLDALVGTLKQLSAKRVASGSEHKIRVYICFSSRSAFQKLFHTSSADGYNYGPNAWQRKLALPSPAELPGLDFTVKSLFFRPFSVLHSKYLIVDRQRVYLPSCNVSWEDWYECVIGFEGPVVKDVFEFWTEVWRPKGVKDLDVAKPGYFMPVDTSALRTTVLPHPHNQSILQSLFFLAPKPPSTPLTTTLLHLFTHAQTSIVMLTPNFTSKRAFDAVCFALRNGVDVHLITNRRMMVPEQLITAGTITEWVVRRLVRTYEDGFGDARIRRRLDDLQRETSAPRKQDVAGLGSLTVSYFKQPLSTFPTTADDTHDLTAAEAEAGLGIARQATKSHVKLTLVDRRAIVLGSGNMDRASWTTSQELGVLIEDRDGAGRATGYVERLWTEVEKGLDGCLEMYFDSAEGGT